MSRELPTIEEAYTKYRKRVYSVCFRMLHSPEAAEDMTQEVFMHLIPRIGQFKGDSAFSTWLHRITVNLTLMKLRKRRVSTVSLEAMQEDAQENGSSRSFSQAIITEDERLRATTDRTTLERVMDAMPFGYRLAIEMELQGFTHEEVAEITETSIGNSKSQLHKARQWIADRLGIETIKVPESSLDDLFADFGQFADESELCT